MKVTLNSGKTIEAVSVEESFNPRGSQNTVLSIRMACAENVAQLREIFTPEETATVQVEYHGETVAFEGYTKIDSVRRYFDDQVEYNATVDLVQPK